MLEFDFSSESFPGAAFFQVEYITERVLYDISSEETRETVESFARRKSPDWAYEDECRFVFNLSSTKKVVSVVNKPLYLLPIGAKAIRSVTFGLHTPDILKEKVYALQKRNDLAHVTFYQIHSDRVKFLFYRQPIT